MTYRRFFTLADDYVDNTDTYVSALSDGFLKSRFAGFLSVSAVTVYELCVKDIFIEFARQKHKVFGEFVSSRYERLNGRIRLGDLRGDMSKFGSKYKDRFERKISSVEARSLAEKEGSVLAAYENVIQWRHSFAHSGEVPTQATYEEVKRSYQLGKHVVVCLHDSMKR